jgi:hypothetical protein
MSGYNLCDDCEDHEVEQTIILLLQHQQTDVEQLLMVLLTQIDQHLTFQNEQITKLGKIFKSSITKILRQQEDVISGFITDLVNAVNTQVREQQVAINLLQQMVPSVNIAQLSVYQGGIANVGGTTGTGNNSSGGAVNYGQVTSSAQTSGGTESSQTNVSNYGQGGSTSSTGGTANTTITNSYTTIIGGSPVTEESINTSNVSNVSNVSSISNVQSVGPSDTISNYLSQWGPPGNGQSTAGGEQRGIPYPVDPEQDPVAYRFAPDDNRWKPQVTAWGGDLYAAWLAAPTMDDFNQLLNDAIGDATPLPQIPE